MKFVWLIMASISTLSDPQLAYIFQYLDDKDAKPLKKVSKHWARVAEDREYLASLCLNKDKTLLLPDELLYLIFSFSKQSLGELSLVCRRWKLIIDHPSFIKPLYQQVTGALLSKQEIEEASNGYPLQLYRKEMFKRKFNWTVPSPHKSQESVAISIRNLRLESSLSNSDSLRKTPNHNEMQLEPGSLNQDSPLLPPLESQELEVVNTPYRICLINNQSDHFIQWQYCKNSISFSFDPKFDVVHLKDLKEGLITSFSIPSTIPTLPNCTYTYFDGTRIAAVYKLQNQPFKGSVVKIFDLMGREKKEINFAENNVTSVNIVILDYNFCWIFTAGCILQCWDIESTPKLTKSISFFDQLNQLTTTRMFRNPIRGEVDSTHSKFTITCDNDTVFTIDTAPPTDIFSERPKEAEESLSEEESESASSQESENYSPTYERRDSSMKRVGSYPLLNARIKKIRTGYLKLSQ